MTREKYLEMMNQLGKDPIEEEIPPDLGDFPEIVIDAITTFNMLGDRVYPDIGFVGKDYTNLNVYLDLYQIEDTEFFLQILHWFEGRAVKQSNDQIKKEHEKLKRQSRGK